MYFGIILYASGVTSYLSTFVYDGTVFGYFREISMIF